MLQGDTLVVDDSAHNVINRSPQNKQTRTSNVRLYLFLSFPYNYFNNKRINLIFVLGRKCRTIDN